MLTPVYSSQFKRDIRKVQHRGYNIDALKTVIRLLLQEEILPAIYKDHPLRNNWKSFRELHIEPDWLLVYKIVDATCIFTRTGTHADLFGK